MLEYEYKEGHLHDRCEFKCFQPGTRDKNLQVRSESRISLDITSSQQSPNRVEQLENPVHDLLLYRRQ